MTEVDKTQPVHRSHLFTVRLWIEELGDDQVEWRGQMQHVLSGEMRYTNCLSKHHEYFLLPRVLNNEFMIVDTANGITFGIGRRWSRCLTQCCQAWKATTFHSGLIRNHCDSKDFRSKKNCP